MPSDFDLLQGVWAVSALEMDGQAMPECDGFRARIAIEGDRFTSTGMGAIYAGTFKLDAAAKPRRIDMTFDVGPEAGNINRGIYELKAGVWKLCLATRGDARPAAFATARGSGVVLETLKRATGKAAKLKAKAVAASPMASDALRGGYAGHRLRWRMAHGFGSHERRGSGGIAAPMGEARQPGQHEHGSRRPADHAES